MILTYIYKIFFLFINDVKLYITNYPGFFLAVLLEVRSPKPPFAFRGRLVSSRSAIALRDLTVAFPPIGVTGGFGLIPI